MKTDATQKLAFLGTTVFTLLLLYMHGKGFSFQFRSMNPEMWFYAVIQAIASTSIFCLSTYLVFVIIDLIRSKRRFMGWLLCAVLSWACVFTFLWILPPSHAYFTPAFVSKEERIKDAVNYLERVVELEIAKKKALEKSK